MAGVDEVLGRLVAPRRFNTALLTLFATTALLLAVIGVYRILAQFLAARSREIGIRMALGADRQKAIGSVMRNGLSVLAAGSATGVAGAVASVHLLSGLIYGNAVQARIPAVPREFGDSVLTAA